MIESQVLKLPAEINLRICSYLDESSLKSIKLVAREMRPIAHTAIQNQLAIKVTDLNHLDSILALYPDAKTAHVYFKNQKIFEGKSHKEEEVVKPGWKHTIDSLELTAVYTNNSHVKHKFVTKVFPMQPLPARVQSFISERKYEPKNIYVALEIKPRQAVSLEQKRNYVISTANSGYIIDQLN